MFSQITLPNFVIGSLSLAAGVFIIIKAFYINHHILFVGWAERKWGPGSGTTFYQLFGAFLCFFGLFVALGYIDVYGSAFGNTKSNEIEKQLQNQQTAPVNSNKNRIVD